MGDMANHNGISKKDVEILRTLAKRVAELAVRPVEDEKKRLWYGHNALKPTRPVVFCDPENGWNEIITPDQLKCEDATARGFEMKLRKEIFWGESMGDDRVVDPYVDIGYIHTNSGWGLEPEYIGGKNGNAYRWEAPLKDYSTSFSKLKFPEIKVDYEKTDELYNLAGEIFGDLITVRKKSIWCGPSD